MSTSTLLVEILILGFQVFIWISLIVAILFGYDWIPFSVLRDWIPILALFVVGFSYTLGTIFDNLFFSLFENRRIANSFIKRIVLDEVARKAMQNWMWGEKSFSREIEIPQRVLRKMHREWNHRARVWKQKLKQILMADDPRSLWRNLENIPDEWKEAMKEELPGLRGPEWERISSRDPRQVRLYILSDNEELGKELEKYLKKAGLARGSSLNLVIIGALSLILYLMKSGFALSVFLFGIFFTIGFAVLAYFTWRQSSFVYYYTLWDLLKLTERLREERLREDR